MITACLVRAQVNVGEVRCLGLDHFQSVLYDRTDGETILPTCVEQMSEGL